MSAIQTNTPLVSPETRAHERKETVSTVLGAVFILGAVLLTGFGVWKTRMLFPDTMGHLGKWPIGIIAMLLVGYLATKLVVRLETWWLKVPSN